MPLAIMYPEIRFLLVDSIGKKIKVVNEVASALGLNNLRAEHIRAEKVKGAFDYVVTRAVMRMKPLIQTVRGATDNNSIILALKGGDLKEELSEIRGKAHVYDLKDHFSEEFFETKKLVEVAGR